MCVNYVATTREQLFHDFGTPIPEGDWEPDVYRDYKAPFIIHNGESKRISLIGSFGFVPKRCLPKGIEFSTMNARDDKLGIARNYKPYWMKSQLCLVPMHHFYEPNWEGEAHVRWKIGMADGAPFAVAGMYREWPEEGGGISYAFTQITVNADGHPLMMRFHKPGEEKRSLVIVPPSEWDNWLSCKNPEVARSFLHLHPAELMAGAPAPRPKSANSRKKPKATTPD